MSPTVIFLLAAALLLALVLLLLLPPLLRGARPASPDGESQRAANVRIYRDQLAELENDRAAGTLAEAEFIQARDELQHRLLEEAAGSAESIAPRRHNPRLAFVLLFALPQLSSSDSPFKTIVTSPSGILRTISASITSWSPGTTGRLKRTLSTEAK